MNVQKPDNNVWTPTMHIKSKSGIIHLAKLKFHLYLQKPMDHVKRFLKSLIL